MDTTLVGFAFEEKPTPKNNPTLCPRSGHSNTVSAPRFDPTAGPRKRCARQHLQENEKTMSQSARLKCLQNKDTVCFAGKNVVRRAIHSVKNCLLVSILMFIFPRQTGRFVARLQQVVILLGAIAICVGAASNSGHAPATQAFLEIPAGER